MRRSSKLRRMSLPFNQVPLPVYSPLPLGDPAFHTAALNFAPSAISTRQAANSVIVQKGPTAGLFNLLSHAAKHAILQPAYQHSSHDPNERRPAGMPQPAAPIPVFCSFAPEDEPL